MTEDWGAILVVDDDAEMRDLVHDVLKDRGHQVTTAGSGRVPIHVSVIHVMVPLSVAPITIKSMIPWNKYPKLKEANHKLLEPSVRKLVKAGYTAKPLCRVGKPAEEIMKVAAKQQADLIIMGAQGLGAIDRFLLGSVSTRVVQQATCAVLVVR